MRALPLVALLAAACKGPAGDSESDSEPDTEAPPAGDEIIVYLTTDTLGQTAANVTGECERLTTLFAGYGIDLACVQGGVSPSTFTMTSHTRMLWPQMRELEFGTRISPRCSDLGMPELLRQTRGGAYVAGLENGVMASDSGRVQLCEGVSSFGLGADEFYANSGHDEPFVLMPDADRAITKGIDALLAATAEGGPAFGFYNVFEVGGHVPRCVLDPNSAPCDELWAYGVDNGFFDPEADRLSTFTDPGLIREVDAFAEAHPEAETAARALYWSTTLDTIEVTRDPLFEARLRTLLDGLQAQGRLDDLRIVILGDHGENPCMLNPLTGLLNCGHNRMPTVYSANVPVWIAPASLADELSANGFIGSATEPWSTVNLAFGLTEHVGIAAPAEWGAPEPVGTATSSHCSGTSEGSGVHIIGDRAIACNEDDCMLTGWSIPEDGSAALESLGAIPSEFDPWNTSPPPFAQSCE